MKLFCLVFLVGLSLLSCRNAPEPEVREGPFNLILISLDTVRSDYLQLYQESGAPTPNLNRIASKSYVFHHAIAQVPYTLPSHSTLFTGAFPSTHGVGENTGATLPDRMQTLAEVLKSNGYHTAAFPGAMVLSASTGIAQGFDYYDDSFSHQDLKSLDLSGVQRNAESVMNSFLSWLEREKPSSYFAFLHLYDAHDPYDPPPPFTPQTRSIQELYKGELRYVDSILGILFERLNSKQQLQNSLIVIAGDHGEMLGEHGENTHGYFVYQAALRVPLIISIPGSSARHDMYAPVMIAEIMPTVLDLMNVPAPDTMDAASIRAIMKDGSSQNRFVYAESQTAARHFGAAPLFSIQDSKLQYIESPRPELYDLNSDYSSRINVITQHSAAAAQLKKQMSNFLKRPRKAANDLKEISPEQTEQLASLGYIAPGSNVPSTSRDPKDLVGSWQDLNRLNDLLREDKFTEAIPLIERLRKAGASHETLDLFEARVLAGTGNAEKAEKLLNSMIANNKQPFAASAILAAVLEKSGKSQEAAELYRKIAEEQNSPYSLENYAKHMLRMKKEPELLEYLIQSEAKGQFSNRFSTTLGEIYMNLKQFDRAGLHLQQAVELNPDSSQATVLLAMVYDAQGRTRDALMLLEGASGRFTDANYYLQLGLIYHRSGNLIRERQMFELMMNEHPDDPRGYLYLARFLLDQKANPQTIIQLANQGLSLKPNREFQAFGYYLLSDSYDALGKNDRAKHYLNLAERSRN